MFCKDKLDAEKNNLCVRDEVGVTEERGILCSTKRQTLAQYGHRSRRPEVYCLTPQKENYQEKPKIWDKKGRIYKVNLWTDNELDGNANGLTDTMVTYYTKHCDLDSEAAEMLAADTKCNGHDCRMFKSYRYNWSNVLIAGDGATRKGFFHRGHLIITFVDAYVIL